MRLKTVLRGGINRLGFDVIRCQRSPKLSLLGLTGLDIATIIDVGANKGQFARMISGFFPRAELYCFEPLEEPFRELSVWSNSQGGQVRCFQLALGDQEGEAEMHLHEDHIPSSSLLSATVNYHSLCPQTKAECLTRVRVTTLDRALKDTLERMPEKMLLKLDVQGFGDPVLRGAERVLGRCRAVLLEVCLAPLYKHQADFFRLTQLLYDAGLHYAGNLDQAYGPDGRVVFLDALFVK